MQFGLVSGVGRVIGVLHRGGDRRRGRGSFGSELGHPIVIDGDFARATCSSEITLGRTCCQCYR